MEDYDVRSAASILASVKEQEARFEQLTRALEEERRNVTVQLERANLPPNSTASQPLAWQQVVMQLKPDYGPLSLHVGGFERGEVEGGWARYVSRLRVMLVLQECVKRRALLFSKGLIQAAD
ncbi:hypothetical protein JOB18_041654 [Solea senegalensis]|uniref:Uncharacterized protein n=1 Tax=Solea senegalensis TaxID=28829 RepID=A0AAV6QHX5_SOLSE|nr:hypothetical protein JOB18_041654 [Solea senegalensis]